MDNYVATVRRHANALHATVTEIGSVLGWFHRFERVDVVSFDSADGRSGRAASAISSAESFYYDLAQGYDRWGLGPEAEVSRLKARQVTVDRMLVEAHVTPDRPVRNCGTRQSE